MEMLRPGSLYVATLAFFTIASRVVAHRCGDGNHVTCMAVQQSSLDGAPASTHGMGADGYPMCTPAGSKVFCLVNHDYHYCAAGQQPCCVDGSDPTHGTPGAEEQQDDGVTCFAEGAHQIIVDTMEPSLMTEQTNLFRGTYQPCMKDAYNGQYHHDNAENKGTANFSFTFDPPESGCYNIEEFHPGRDSACSQHLPTNAILDVDYCRDLSASFSINQAQNPSQWNEVGALMFYKGKPGKLTMRNAIHETCGASLCYMVVDAFRLTRIGDHCSSPEPIVSAREGILMMVVKATEGGDAHDTRSWVHETLAEHNEPMEVSLQAHLGYQSVEVHEVKAPRRRWGNTFEVTFTARRPVGHTQPVELKQVLDANFVSSGLPLQVVSARVVWKTDGGDLPALWTIIVGIAVAVFAVCICCTCAARAWKWRRNVAKQPCEVHEQADAENPTASDSAVKEKEAETVSETGSGSTEAPASEEASPHDGMPVVKERTQDVTEFGRDGASEP